MNPVDLILGFRKRILREGSKNYRQNILNKSNDKIPEYEGITKIFNKLTNTEQEDLLKFMRLVSIDTTSELLGWLDGNYMVEDQDDFPELKIEDKEVNGDLQAIWIALEEGEDQFELWKLHE